jgi:hypothetical protein
MNGINWQDAKEALKQVGPKHEPLIITNGRDMSFVVIKEVGKAAGACPIVSSRDNSAYLYATLDAAFKGVKRLGALSCKVCSIDDWDKIQ